MAETHWSLGVLVWGPIAVVIALVLLILTVLLFAAWRADRRDNVASHNGVPVFAWIGSAIVLALFLAGNAFPPIGFWPYEAEYHQWQTISGEVTAIDTRLLRDGEGMSERFVVTFENGEQRGCDDTRCASVKVGDTLTLTCKREWQYQATDGYGCNWIGYEDSTP